MNSTLGSVVPLAMFEHIKVNVKRCQFTKNCHSCYDRLCLTFIEDFYTENIFAVLEQNYDETKSETKNMRTCLVLFICLLNRDRASLWKDGNNWLQSRTLAPKMCAQASQRRKHYPNIFSSKLEKIALPFWNSRFCYFYSDPTLCVRLLICRIHNVFIS